MSVSDERSPAASANSPSAEAQRPYADRLLSALQFDGRSSGSPDRGLPMPQLRQVQRSDAMDYSVTAIDCDGRLSARSALIALGWRPGLTVAVSVIRGAFVILPEEKGICALDRQGYLRLPASVRHRTRLKAGDRLLLAACKDYELILAYPVAALDAMILAYHLGTSR